VFVIPSALGPTHFEDERRYWEIASQLFSGRPAIATWHFPPVYPLALLPAFMLSFPSGTYDVAKILNAIYFSSGVIPFFILVDRLAGRAYAWAASVVLLVSPAFLVMPRAILSENVFYPLFLWAVLLAGVDLLPRRRWLPDLAMGTTLGLLYLARFIGLALIPAFLLVWWSRLSAEVDGGRGSREKLNRAAHAIAPIVVLTGCWVAAGLSQGVPLRNLMGLGIASNSAPQQLTLGRLMLWFVLYASYAAMIGAPYLGAFAPLLTRPRDLGLSDAQRRWAASVILLGGALLVACSQHSWRARYNFPEPSKLQGRYMLYFLPLFLVTAMILLRRAAERRVGFVQAGAVVAASLVFAGGGFALLFKGWMLLERPVSISLNSPDGYLVGSLGGRIFGLACAGIGALVVLSFGRGPRTTLIAMTLGLILLYGAGGRAIHRTILSPWQGTNLHAKYVGDLLAAHHRTSAGWNLGRRNPQDVHHAVDARRDCWRVGRGARAAGRDGAVRLGGRGARRRPEDWRGGPMVLPGRSL
jgi:hypothetical protein